MITYEVAKRLVNADHFMGGGYYLQTATPYSGTDFQSALSGYVSSLRDPARGIRDALSNTKLWVVLQTQESGSLRLPTKDEILCQVNLALAQGVKGVVYYVYTTVGDESGLLDANRNTTAQYNNVKDINTNYQGTGQSLVTIGGNFLNLTWKDAFSIHQNTIEPISSTYKLYDVTAKPSGGADDPENETYVEVGVLQNGSTNHYMVINRRCTASETREVTVTFQTTTNKIYRLTDVYTGGTITYYIGGVSTTFPYTLTLGPGQGKLLKLEDLGAFSGSWSGNVTTNTAWVGTITVTTNVTVNSGVSLIVVPSSVIQFASGTSLTVSGKLTAESNDPNKRITFTGTTATPGFWNGIKINSGSSTNVSTLRRCDVQYATDGIKITYTGNSNNVTVDKCNIRNNSYGVYINGNGYSGATVHPTISNNFITDNDATGIDLENYAKPTITGNRIENNYMGYGISANSNSSATITYNFISGHALVSGIDLGYSSLAQLHRNTIRNNALDGVSMFFNSNVTAYGADTTKGRNDIRFNNDNGIYAYQSSPIFGKDVSNEWGNNWISDNAGYQAYQNYAGYLVLAERCYWNGQQSDVFGNVDVSPYLISAPSPVGWGKSDTYDPTYLQPSKPETMTELPRAETTHNLMTSVVAAGTNGSPVNWSEDLKAAIDEGLTTGDWSRASELITGLHRELQDARLPNVDFTLVADYADNPKVISFVRKMLALVLMEKDLVENRVVTALAKLTAFGQNNAEHKAELLANAGLIHLYRQNDFAAAQNVLAQLQTMAQSGDASAVEHVKVFGRIIENYQRRRSESSTELGKPIATPPQTLTPPTTPALAQNYPNPFNPTTIIRFHLDERQKVRLVIYDLTGHRVRTLVEGELPAGEQTISWDGRDQYGRSAASGIYFYELVLGNQVERRKMTLIR